jgi:L,D-transpeptidase catalytic domain
LRRITLGIAIAAALPGGGVAHAADKQLSNERTVTRWAHPWARSVIHAAPRPSSPARGRLRFQTEDRMPEVYLALRSHEDRLGREWIQTRVLGRPNGRKGWVLREALGGFNVVRTHLTVNRRTLTATLRRRGRVIWSSRIGVGKGGTPTPRGNFYIRERLKSLGGAYGPWAFGTSAYSSLSDWPGGGVVGIHGTNQPNLIPGRPSHGCVRVPNHKIRQLKRLMPIGTPVKIV